MSAEPPLPEVLRMRRDLGAGELPSPSLPPDLYVTGFETADCAGVHALIEHAYRDGAGAIAPFREWREAFLADAEFDARACFVVRRPTGVLVGVALCWSSGFVRDLAVAADHRRLGVGWTLVATALAHFRERGHATVELKVRPREAPGALALYRAAGFEEVGPA